MHLMQTICMRRPAPPQQRQGHVTTFNDIATIRPELSNDQDAFLSTVALWHLLHAASRPPLCMD